jgi:fatty acid synthase, animal type
LKTTIFRADNVEKAFRFLASGKHMGKVLIQVREHEDDLETIPIDVKRQVFFTENKSCILVGGLGGFGLELADWLVIRGCRHLVMSSSRGITNGYQAARIK